MKPPRWKRAMLAVDKALAWPFDHILLCLAIAVIVLMAIVADEYGGDEIEHHRATALTVEDRAAESRYLKAEAAMERDLAVATSAAR